MEIILTSKADLRAFVTESIEKAFDARFEKPTPEKEWLTNKEAMALLDVSKATLQRYRNSGLIPYSKVEGNVYYRSRDIQMLLVTNRRRRRKRASK